MSTFFRSEARPDTRALPYVVLVLGIKPLHLRYPTFARSKHFNSFLDSTDLHEGSLYYHFGPVVFIDQLHALKR
jgi:hypothetical protein